MGTKGKKRKSRNRRNLAEHNAKKQDPPPPESEQDTDQDTQDEDFMDFEETGREPPKEWVSEAIRKVVQSTDENMVKEFFLTGQHGTEMTTQIMMMNKEIGNANQARGLEREQYGIIPEHAYNAMCTSWVTEQNKREVQNDRSKLWKAFDITHTTFNNFNKAYGLPLGWNVSASDLEQLIGKRPLDIPDQGVEQNSDSETSDEEPLFEDDSDSGSDREETASEDITGLDRLETRARKEANNWGAGKVLYWWRKGAGSQIFVRYGTKQNPVYRIRAGSYEYWDERRVERIVSPYFPGTNTRGLQKVQIKVKDGTKEAWKWGRDDVYDILGVGWKIIDDDDDQCDPLDYIAPEPGAKYPETRVLVKWKDGKTTLETRTFIRRITKGSTLMADRIIYQKAKELEEMYQDAQIAEEDEADEIDVTEETDEVEVAVARTPARVPAKAREITPNRPAKAAAKVPNKAPTAAPVQSSRSRSPALQKGNAPQSTTDEDPRDLEIRRLREQLQQQSQLQAKQFARTTRRRPTNRNDNDGNSEVSSKPPIPPLRRNRRGEIIPPFSNWG
ncbi:uncharacterized protein LDX57_009110 [Aspergillus melleus]|uniref:uncharacterized protein n=1 Tax=Aspergillus melleus TaxID=138277 RepID=UPI001E8CA64A|nr:uncharacterized protein LDX57_009110 [Aspergillus melleus]KAH8431448.1 hypothetical protein LDX57_009110 [Aspergillus melleus]